MELDAHAIYFYDVTHHFESLKLEREFKAVKSRHDQIETSQLIVSHEFRTPLSTSLMFLEGILTNKETAVAKEVRQVIILVISQINLLLSLVNDMLDMKLIDEGKFTSKKQAFNVHELFQFI